MKKRVATLIAVSFGSILVLLAGMSFTGMSFAVTERRDEGNSGSMAEGAKATAVLHPTEGNKVHGVVTFTKTGDQVKVVADIEGLTPGKHGFHIHEWGDCSSKDGAAAGGHFNPAQAPHGAPTDAKRHEGDLGNIEADQSGKARLELTDSVMKFDGQGSIIGRAVIVHASPDDFKTQPTGNAGGRQACAVIGLAKP